MVVPRSGRSYRVVVEYRSGALGNGEVGIRNLISGLAPTQRVPLKRTDGVWTREEFQVDVDRGGKPMYLFIQNLAHGAGDALSLRVFEEQG